MVDVVDLQKVFKLGVGGGVRLVLAAVGPVEAFHASTQLPERTAVRLFWREA
jgi:hypothetical protein